MGWNGSITPSSALGASATFTPGTSAEGTYAVSSFTAPAKGVYRFVLKGSGGTQYASPEKSWNHCAPGGAGGQTVGYLLLNQGQTVYVGAGGTCCAAFVAAQSGSGLSAIAKAKVYFVAAGGGAGGAAGESKYKSGVMAFVLAGGSGGGMSGAASSTVSWNGAGYGATGGAGGTQSAGGTPGGWTNDESTGTGASGAYGTGGKSTASTYDTAVARGGRGGDGLYGGGSGNAYADSSYHTYAYGGGGGSSYYKAASLTVGVTTYYSATTAGGGAAANTAGSVQVTYYARAQLPVFFDGTQLEAIFFNDTQLTGLVYNGTAVMA